MRSWPTEFFRAHVGAVVPFSVGGACALLVIALLEPATLVTNPKPRALSSEAAAATVTMSGEHPVVLEAAAPTDPSSATIPEVLLSATGDDWGLWYPGPDARLSTSDDVDGGVELTLPAHAVVRIRLRSADYVRIFSIPGQQLSQVAVPGLNFDLVLRTSNPGDFAFRFDHFCGLPGPPYSGVGRVEGGLPIGRLVSLAPRG